MSKNIQNYLMPLIDFEGYPTIFTVEVAYACCFQKRSLLCKGRIFYPGGNIFQ